MGLLGAALLRIAVLVSVLDAPLSITNLLTIGYPGTTMVTERELDQLETRVV